MLYEVCTLVVMCLHGILLPGCVETFETSFPLDGGREQFFDKHQKVYRYKEGDILALTVGVVHWTYNEGDTSNVANQLDRNFKKFFLAGNPQSQEQQGEPWGQSQQPGGRHGQSQRPGWETGRHGQSQRPGWETRPRQSIRPGWQPSPDCAKRGVTGDFAVIKKAGEEGCEWVAFKTNNNTMTTQLAGRFSYIRALPEEVLMNSYSISREDAKILKYSRKEGVVLSPWSGSISPIKKPENVVYHFN
ncbi:putative 11-S seed storage protein, plant [Helianthus anomalus]